MPLLLPRTHLRSVSGSSSVIQTQGQLTFLPTIQEHCVTVPSNRRFLPQRIPHRKCVGIRIPAPWDRTDGHVVPLFITIQSAVAVVGIGRLVVSIQNAVVRRCQNHCQGDAIVAGAECRSLLNGIVFVDVRPYGLGSAAREADGGDVREEGCG